MSPDIAAHPLVIRLRAAEAVCREADDLVDWGDLGMPRGLRDALSAWRQAVLSSTIADGPADE